MTAGWPYRWETEMSELSALYDKDFSAWASWNAELLKKGRFLELDIDHLVEELLDMGASERNELESRLVILLAHLLKWQYQYRHLSEQWREFKGDSWRSTLIEQRSRITKRLNKSPSLKARLAEIIPEAYQDAVEIAAKETGFPVETFPEECPYGWEQIISDEFYPEEK